MASIIEQRNGRRTIQFRGPDDKRRSIRLGIVEDSLVDEVKVHVEHLSRCWEKQTPPSKQTDEWVCQLLADPSRLWIYDRLAAVGLLVERERPEEDEKPHRNSLKLGAFLDRYFARVPM